MADISFDGKKRLHFFLDEKVVNDTIENFELVFPNENLYVVLSKDGTAKFVKAHKNTLLLSYKSTELKQIINNSDSFDAIICHSMWYELAKIVKKISHPNITWIIWGVDLYEKMIYRKGFKLYFNEASLFKIRAQRLPVCLYKFFISIRDYIHFRTVVKANQKISNVVCCKEDYDLMVNFYPDYKRLLRKDFFYYPIEKMLDSETRSSFVSGKDVWVNNSANYNGNHVEVFQRLTRIEWDGVVHTPLSYGSCKYAKYVCEKGEKLLGNKFDPMMNFIPKHDYYKKFLGTNAFIFGHLRQCALGNIIIALYLGAKVYLFKENPLYHCFENMGIILFNIDDNLSKENLLSPLPDKLRQRNRELISKTYSHERLMKLIKENF